MPDEISRCPSCGRTIKTHYSPFGDRCYNRHAIATAKSSPNEIHADYRPSYDVDRALSSETTCPMSGQMVEN